MVQKVVWFSIHFIHFIFCILFCFCFSFFYCVGARSLLLILHSCGIFSHLIYYIPQFQWVLLLSLIFLVDQTSFYFYVFLLYLYRVAALCRFWHLWATLCAAVKIPKKSQKKKSELEIERKMANFMAQYRAPFRSPCSQRGTLQSIVRCNVAKM